MSQKTDEVEDLRIRRTKKLLQQALIQLTVEKGFPAVTINDIAERAMVNRSTFYRHYLDKYDLLDQYMEEVYALVAVPHDPSGPPASVMALRTPPPGLLNLIKHIQSFADFYRVMLGPRGDPAFTQRFRQISEKRYRFLLSGKNEKDGPNIPPIDLVTGYISYAGVGAILWWLENDQPCTAEQLAIWIGQLSMTAAGLLGRD